MISLRVVMCAVAIVSAPVAAIGVKVTLMLRTLLVDRDNLECFLLAERGQDRGQTAGEHGLPCSGRAYHQ